MTNKTMPGLLATKAIQGNINKLVSIFGPGSKSLELLAETAFQCLLHASKHGDVTLCERLYKSLGGVDKGRAAAAIRIEALKSWFAKHGPITARNGKWQIKEGTEWKDEKNWTLQEACDRPFWEDMGEERVQPFSVMNILTLLTGMPKRIDNAVEKGSFQGDAVAAKTYAANVLSFAEAEAKRLTPAQRGEHDKTADAILKAAETQETAVVEERKPRSRKAKAA